MCDKLGLAALDVGDGPPFPGADGTAQSYLNYMSTPYGWADELAIAAWQEVFFVRVHFRTNRGEHPVPISPLWSTEYKSWPVITLGWLRSTVNHAAVGRHFVYTSEPSPAVVIVAHPGGSTTSIRHEADGFDSDTLTVPNGDTDLPAGEAFTEPSAQISQGAADDCESLSEVEVSSTCRKQRGAGSATQECSPSSP